MNNQTNFPNKLLNPESEKHPIEHEMSNLRQPYLDVIGIWKGFDYSAWDSKARIRIWKGDNCHLVVVSDLDEPDSGTSITNSSEKLATFIRRDFNLDGTILWFEHYPRHNTPECIRQASHLQEEISLVTYKWDGQRYRSPRWVYIEREAAETLLHASLDMEGYRSLSLHRFSCPVLI